LMPKEFAKSTSTLLHFTLHTSLPQTDSDNSKTQQLSTTLNNSTEQ
jgi:hypothetical protein